jgi:hypothetical protein
MLIKKGAPLPHAKEREKKWQSLNWSQTAFASLKDR